MAEPYITSINISKDDHKTFDDVATGNQPALPMSSNGVSDGVSNGVSNAAFVPDKPDEIKGGKSEAEQVKGQSASSKQAQDKGDNALSLIPDGEYRTPPSAAEKPRQYKARWFMLSLFCLYSFSNAYQWIHLNIIADVLINYYNESLPSDTFQRNNTIDWLSMIYMLAYIPLIFPATWILDKKGLRICCILGSLLNATGAWLKCASVSTDRFPLLMFAQTICGIAQVWILGIPPRLAAVWFGANEVSTATAIGVFGNQVGVAAGFLIPPMLVPNSDNLDTIGTDFSIMFYCTAGLTTIIFFLIIIFYKEKPDQPPSRAQQLAVEAATHEHYFRSLSRLFRNKNFVLLVVTYGVNTGTYYAISTLLNAIVLHYFPGEGENAGRIGLTIVLMGVLGSVLAGIWLDKTRTYKGTTTGIYFLSLAGAVAFAFTIDLNHIWIVFLTAGSLGFFMTGYLPVGFEFCAELTFPESEGTSSGMLNASAQTFGIIFTLGMRAMMDSVSILSSLITVCVSLLIGGILTAIIKPDYRRQGAEKELVEEYLNQSSEVTVAQNIDKSNDQGSSSVVVKV